MAITFESGERDELLAGSFDFAQSDPAPANPPKWPVFDPVRWQPHLRAALEQELAESLAAIRARQEQYLRRELERIDRYFSAYEQELGQRKERSRAKDGKVKTEQRLAAARIEHERRRQDQVQRHEIRVLPHTDALLLVAEPAWEGKVSFLDHHHPASETAQFVPRTRRWVRTMGSVN